jgi:hypothetical protein
VLIATAKHYMSANHAAKIIACYDLVFFVTRGRMQFELISDSMTIEIHAIREDGSYALIHLPRAWTTKMREDATYKDPHEIRTIYNFSEAVNLIKGYGQFPRDEVHFTVIPTHDGILIEVYMTLCGNRITAATEDVITWELLDSLTGDPIGIEIN